MTSTTPTPMPQTRKTRRPELTPNDKRRPAKRRAALLKQNTKILFQIPLSVVHYASRAKMLLSFQTHGKGQVGEN